MVTKLLLLKEPSVKDRRPSKIQCLLSAESGREPSLGSNPISVMQSFYHILLSSPEGANRSVFLLASLRPNAPRSRDAVPLLARFISSAKHCHSVVSQAFFYNLALWRNTSPRVRVCAPRVCLRCVTSHSVDHPT